MFELSDSGKKKVQEYLSRYETKRSAIIPALFIAQQENGGWVSSAVIRHLSEFMDLPITQISEVFTFYTMFNKKPMGANHIQICGNVSCAMAGGRDLVEYLCEKLNVSEGEVTEDGRFSVSRVECLGSCDTAPVLQINTDPYIENVDKEKLDQLVNELKTNQ